MPDELIGTGISHYFNISTSANAATTAGIQVNPYITITDGGFISFGDTTISQQGVKKGKDGIHPELYFKYIKSKFGVLERLRLDRRVKRLEKAFNEAVEAGQYILAEKFLTDYSRELRESMIYAKGFKFFIEREDLMKHRNNIREGHISDTRLEEYTRIIPKAVLAKKKKAEGLFDGFVVYHYWNDEVEKKVAEKQKMTPSEERAMRDPVLFGYIKECNRLYFIADWEDEFCDLTFDEIIDALGKEDEEITLTHKPKL